MAELSYTAICSVDGFIADEDGNFDWAMPSDEVHAFINDRERPGATHLYGRRMYEIMQGWETEPAIGESSALAAQFAELWQSATKIVYSTTLHAPVTKRTTIEREFDAERVRKLKETASGEMAISGPNLAAHAFRAGLVDRCDLYYVPHAVGSGNPALPRGVRVSLNLLEQRVFENGTLFASYAVQL